MEQSQNAMNRLNGAVEELIRVVQQQRQEFNTQLIAEKNKAQTAENKVAVLEAQAQTLANENEKLKVELDLTGIDLDEYKLKWISKVIDTTPVPKDKKVDKDVILTIPCPNCMKEIEFSKKELLSK